MQDLNSFVKTLHIPGNVRLEILSEFRISNFFVKTLHIPESLTINKHVFAPPQPNDPAHVSYYDFLNFSVK